MSESIKQYKTIESSSKSEFNSSVNFHLDLGWKILDNSFNVNVIHENDNIINVQINKDDLDNPKIFTEKEHGFTETTYLQVLIWDENKDDKITFHDNGRLESRTVFKNKQLLIKHLWNKEGVLIKEIKCDPSNDSENEKDYTDEGLLRVDYKKINGEYVYEKRYNNDGSKNKIVEYNKEGKQKLIQYYKSNSDGDSYLEHETKINKSTNREKYFHEDGNLSTIATIDYNKGIRTTKSYNSSGSLTHEGIEQRDLKFNPKSYYHFSDVKILIPTIEDKSYKDGVLEKHEYRDKEYLITKIYKDKFQKDGRISKKIKLSNKFHNESFTYNKNGEIERKYIYDYDKMICTDTYYIKNKISKEKRHVFQVRGGGTPPKYYPESMFHISNIKYDKNGNIIEDQSNISTGKFWCKQRCECEDFDIRRKHKDGHKILEGEFIDGLENGIFTYYYGCDDTIRKKEIYKNGELIETRD